MPAGDRPQLRLGMSAPDERAADVGTYLRRAREQRGLTLQQLADSTKISVRTLDALERNQLSKLPGGIFSRSFVRNYAREVGLDPEAAAAKFVAAFPDDVARAEVPAARVENAEGFESHRRVAASAVRLLGTLGVVVVLALVAYAWWQRREAASVPPPVSVAAASDRVLDPPAPDASDQIPGAAGGTAAAGDAAGVAGEPAAPTPIAAEEPAAVPPQRAPLVVGLTASGECWLSATVDGAVQAQRVLGPGERAEFEARRAVTLRIGNAGALAMTLNGTPAKTLGRVGEVVTITIPANAIETFLR